MTPALRDPLEAVCVSRTPLAGYQEVLREQGIEMDEQANIEGDFSGLGRDQGMTVLLTQKVTVTALVVDGHLALMEHDNEACARDVRPSGG